MSTLTITTNITKKERVEVKPAHICICNVHGVFPVVSNIYSGKRKDKFQGVLVECKEESCLVYGWTITDAIEKWNKINSEQNRQRSVATDVKSTFRALANK